MGNGIGSICWNSIPKYSHYSPASTAEWSCASTGSQPGTHSCIQRRIDGLGYVPGWKSISLALSPEIPAIAAHFGVALLLQPPLPWDGVHSSCLLDHHHLLRDLGSSCSDALNVYTPTFATPALSKKRTKFRFPPPPHKCCGSEQVSASHFLLERRSFWQFLDIWNKIMPHFG